MYILGENHFFIWICPTHQTFFCWIVCMRCWGQPLILLCPIPQKGPSQGQCLKLSGPKNRILKLLWVGKNQEVLQEWTLAGWSNVVIAAFGQFLEKSKNNTNLALHLAIFRQFQTLFLKRYKKSQVLYFEHVDMIKNLSLGARKLASK